MTDIDAAFVHKILDVPQREGEPHVNHHREASDFTAGLQVFERVAFRHPRTPLTPLPGRKPAPFDITPKTLSCANLSGTCRNSE